MLNLSRTELTKPLRATLATVAMLFATVGAWGQTAQSDFTKSMTITQNLGAEVPKDAIFRDSTGRTIKFGEVFHGRPVVLIPLFYQCKTGCSLITDSLLKTLAKAGKKEKLVVGQDLDIVLLGIHPKETPDLAANKKVLIMENYGPAYERADDTPDVAAKKKNRAEQGWTALTGDLDNIHKVTEAIGFKYFYDADKDLIRHATCSVILTSEGKISSYTIGNDFPTKLLEDLVEVADRKEIGVKADQSSMFGCIMIDPATGKKSIVIENVVRLFGVLTLLILVTSIAVMTYKSRKDEIANGGQPNGA